MILQRHTSGCCTKNGKYTLFSMWYRGILDVELTDNKFSVSAIGIHIWEISFSEISGINIQPQILGAKVNIIPHAGQGFLFIVDDSERLVTNLKKYNLPIRYNSKDLNSEIRRYKFTNHIAVKIIFIILGSIFLALLVYGIIIASY